MEQDKVKHLEFIQGIITRMNANSFQIKSLAVTIITALVAVFVSTCEVAFIYLGILPTFIFWFLDSYYLQQERKFRGIYDDVAGITTLHDVKLFEMPLNKFKGRQFSYFKVFWSNTLLWFYFSLNALLLISGIILSITDVCSKIKCH